MKIILSRKGFDASHGGVASPILPNGTLFSLPIPSRDSPIVYDELRVGSESVRPLVEDLTNRQVRGEDGAHLDPDFRGSMYHRLPGWRPLFGQADAAQTHLENQGVGVGDLFLFFGWFRQTEKTAQGYRFVSEARDLHVIFGWLQIGEIIRVEQRQSEVPAWAAYHPHFGEVPWNNNTVHVAQDNLLLPEMPKDCAGGGAFDQYRECLRLTAPGRTRRWWQLPRWLSPRDGRTPLTYHPNMDNWTVTSDYTILKSACIGQEFVLDTEHYPEAVRWVHGLICGAT